MVKKTPSEPERNTNLQWPDKRSAEHHVRRDLIELVVAVGFVVSFRHFQDCVAQIHLHHTWHKLEMNKLKPPKPESQ